MSGLDALVSEGAGERSRHEYCEHGQDGERNLNPTYYKAAGEPKAIWEVAGSGHVGGITAQPKEYERRVIGFFERTLLQTS